MLSATVTSVVGGVLLVAALAAVALGLLISARNGWFSRWIVGTSWRPVSLYTGAIILAATAGLYLGGGSSDAVYGFAFFACCVAFYLIVQLSQAKWLRRFLDGEDQ